MGHTTYYNIGDTLYWKAGADDTLPDAVCICGGAIHPELNCPTLPQWRAFGATIQYGGQVISIEIVGVGDATDVMYRMRVDLSTFSADDIGTHVIVAEDRLSKTHPNHGEPQEPAFPQWS